VSVEGSVHRTEHVVRIRATRVGSRRPKVRFDPTPHGLVGPLLELAEVGPDDVVYDLGCGDGRIVIAAARDYGARGVGIDIDPILIDQARRAACDAGVADRVEFLQQDLYEADVRPASVVVLFLLPEANLLLRPRLLSELEPGARIVSYIHDMREWRPERTRHFVDRKGWHHRMFLWVVPPRSTPVSDLLDPSRYREGRA